MIHTLTLNPSLDYHVRVNSLNLGGLNSAAAGSINAGGKGINVSKVLNVLGVPTSAISVLGGFTGREVEQELDALNIPSLIIHNTENTRINVKLHNLSNHEETEINGAAPNFTSQIKAELMALIKAKVKKGDILVLSGSLPPSLPSDFYKQIAQSLPPEIDTVLDTRSESLIPNIHHNLLLKPNIVELEGATGRSLNSVDLIKEAALSLVAKGVQYVIVSMGPQGSLLVSSREALRAEPIKIEVNNSVGAGDSMVAGFLAAYSRQQPIEEAYRLSIACALATLNSADMAILVDINKMLPKIQIRPI